jgi:outer membrane protein assembly factor BamD (BamD/ComL family)
MPRLKLSSSRRFTWQTLVTGLLLAVGLFVLLRLLLIPDPAGALLYARAQRLEEAGMARQALRQYRLLNSTHPESPYAARALQRQADILLTLARGGETVHFQEAIATYRQLANTYPQSPLAGEALLAVGAIATGDLKDPSIARKAYQQVLDSYPNNHEYASEATLRLGRVAMLEGKGPDARKWLQKVLQLYSQSTERAAEAQYRLGETYETLFKNKEHQEWARNAYETTIKSYPNSVWAGNAKERLGMLFYQETAPRDRRVRIEVAPLPDDELADGSMFAVLRPVLAARGIEAGETMLRGLGLEPFYAGFDPLNPARVVRAPFDRFKTAVANAGLLYDIEDGGDAKAALATLQKELDAAHLSAVFTGRWQLAVGYDSLRHQVLLQDGGARFDSMGAGKFAQQWQSKPPQGDSFTLLSFYTPGEDPKLKEKPPLEPVATPGSPAASQTAANTAPATIGFAPVRPADPTPKPREMVSPLTIPAFVWTLQPLPEREVHRRTLRRAVERMRLTRTGNTLLNIEALRALSQRMVRLANQGRKPSVAPSIPGLERGVNAEPFDLPARADNRVDADPAAVEPGVAPVATPTTAPPVASPAPPLVAPVVPPVRVLARVRALLGWRNEPLRHWLNARRDAAAYLDVAASRLKEPRLRQAADRFRESVSALENAAALLPPANALSDGGAYLSDASRAGLINAARSIERARAAEARAVSIMNDVAAGT